MRRVRHIRLLLVLLPLLVLLSACGPTVGIFAGGTWQASGLQNQNIRSLAIDPNNLQDIYAGDVQYGVFVSTNAGQNWVKKSIGLPSQTGINTLAFDDPGKKLYAATDAGLFVSADAAQLWNSAGTPKTGLPMDSYTAIAFDLNIPADVYVGTAHHGVLKSVNNGVSWSAASAGLPTGDTINDLVYDADAHQLWAATDMGVYRSVNGGANWQLLNNGIPAANIINVVLPASTVGGTRGLIYAGTNHGFYLSQDSGANWKQSRDSLAGTGVHAILIDAQKATTIFAATDVGALQSLDSGQTWGGISSGIPRNQSVYALTQGANGFSQLYAASNGIYLYPGNSSVFSADRLLPILVILLFFYLLYYMVTRGRRRSREMLKPERINENPPEPLAPYKAEPEDTTQSKNGHLVSPKLEVGEENSEDTDG
jgi:ligand-binding sensor domain-containing protein